MCGRRGAGWVRGDGGVRANISGTNRALVEWEAGACGFSMARESRARFFFTSGYVVQTIRAIADDRQPPSGLPDPVRCAQSQSI